MDRQLTGALRQAKIGPLNHAAAFMAMLICIAIQGTAVAAQQQPVAVPVIAEETVLDEVVVKGTRLWKLREDMVKTEEKFYALYNELNENDDFDVNCQMEAPLGTRLKKRVCRIAFYEDAEAEAAQAFLRGDMAIDPQTVMLERQADYQKNALTIINGDPRLLKLVREREAIEKKYDAERKRRFKGWFGN